MKFRTILGVVIFFVALPLQVEAMVIFSEIAWMGTTVDANNEWIEIYNFSSTPTDINGWTISNGGALNIELVGVMPPNGVFVLERTDDTSVPDVTASQIYTGALPNSGATLTIRDADGNVVGEPLVGGENWVNIGGDNESKYTAQFTRTGKWVTGPPTPGLPNVEEEEPPPASDDENDDSDSENEEASGGGAAMEVRFMERLEAGGDRTVSVGAAEFFEAHAYDQNGGELAAVRYVWNFGNGEVREGKRIFHQYNYSGSYVVSVTATAPRGYVATDRFVVEATDAMVSIVDVTPQYISLSNSAGREIDLSMWSLRVGEQVFQIPHGTVILTKNDLTFPSSVTGLDTMTAQDIALLYPSGSIAHLYGASRNTAPRVASAQTLHTQTSPTITPAVSKTNSAQDQSQEALVLAAAETTTRNPEGGNLHLWLLALVVVLAVSIGGLLFVRSKEEEYSEASEYKIVDDTEEA